MTAVRAEALKMRLQGKSYNEIQVALGVPKSTLSGWFHSLVLSDSAEARLKSRMLQGTRHAFLKRNKLQTKHAEARARSARDAGKSEIQKISKDDLRLIGTVLYWAEGYKRLKVRNGKERMDHKISFVNSDGEMIKVFIQFLLKTLQIEPKKVRLTMRLYKHINENEARKYWTEIVGLPNPNFFKTTYQISGASKGVHAFNRLPYGTLHVEVCDTAKFHHILGLIEGVKCRW